MKLIIVTYEDNARNPVLTHIFHGESVDEIRGIVNAHMQTDSFFKASMTTKKFQGMKLTNVERWVK